MLNKTVLVRVGSRPKLMTHRSRLRACGVGASHLPTTAQSD
jgi:hypothetical protein